MKVIRRTIDKRFEFNEIPAEKITAESSTEPLDTNLTDFIVACVALLILVVIVIAIYRKLKSNAKRTVLD
jgi:hypothetical protein